MKFENGEGGAVQAGRRTTEADAIGLALNGATDDEIHAFRTRILKAAGITATRAARVLGRRRMTYDKCLSLAVLAGARPGRPGPGG